MNQEDKDMLQEIGRLMAKETYARKVGNSFMADHYKYTRLDLSKEAKMRGLMNTAEGCGLALDSLIDSLDKEIKSCG